MDHSASPLVKTEDRKVVNVALNDMHEKRKGKDKELNNETIVMYRTLTNEAYKPIKKSKKKRDPAEEIRSINVHKMTPAEVANCYGTNLDLGLEKPRLEKLKKRGKLNQISPPDTNYIKKGLGYVFGGFNALMWVAMILSILSYQPLGSLQGGTPAIFNLGVGVLLAFVVTVSAIFYGYVDFNASQAMKAIKQLVADTATVTRDGVVMEVNAVELFPGDIVHLSLGQRVPADVYLLKVSQDVKFDRSILTGESELINGTITKTDENPLETRNLALSSTFIVQGTAKGVVFATGDDTVVGKIFSLSLQEKEERTILQKELDRFTYIISAAAVTSFSIAMIFWGAWTQYAHPLFATAPVAIINSIGCLTAIVPQGLPVCVALALTIIARRMATRKVLVKNLSIVETVGAISVLCSDKTGTLTKGKMFVDKVALIDKDYSDESLGKEIGGQLVLRMAYLCNDAYLSNDTIVGNSTDVAVYRFAIQNSNTAAFKEYSREFSIPFNSKNKYMLVIVKGPSGLEMYLKGAPDVMMPFCAKIMDSNGGLIPVENVMDSITAKQNAWSSQGQRVLMTCYKKLDVDTVPSDDEKLKLFIKANLSGLTITSLIGIKDPPREDVLEAVQTMRTAGVRIFMVTGDFRLTAEAIAKQVGILTAKTVHSLDQMQKNSDAYLLTKGMAETDMKPKDDDELLGLVLNGSDLLEMSKEDWDVVNTCYSEIVFARTSPEQKMKIVQELRLRGDNVVGVTGDGVNDAPALKVADVGLAMGSGSDVAKEAAQMILLNNDFASIPVAIENGRLVFENLKKVTFYVMPTGTYTQMMAVFSNVFFGMQIPLTSYQQVFFSIAHDVIMSVALMYEKAESDLMRVKPRNIRTNRLVDYKFFVQLYLFIGVIIWLSCFGMFFLYWKTQGFGFYDLMFAYDAWGATWTGTAAELANLLATSQSIFYVTMVIMQLGNVMATRNRRVSVLESNPLYGPRQNLVLVGAIVLHICVALMNVYVSTSPGNPNIFLFGSVPAEYWFIPIPLALGLLLCDEGRKLIVRTYPKSWVADIAW